MPSDCRLEACALQSYGDRRRLRQLSQWNEGYGKDPEPSADDAAVRDLSYDIGVGADPVRP